MNHNRFGGARSWAMAGVAIAAVATSAQAQQQRRFDIPRQELALALELFGKQSGKEIVFDSRQTQGKLSFPVRGTIEPGKALQGLLAETGLVSRTVNPDTFMVEKRSQAGGEPVAAISAPAGAAEEFTGIAEVIVTAQKRAERAKDVPASVSVLGRRQLEDLHAGNLKDYAAYVPGLIVDSGGQPGESTITMRGLNPRGDTTMVATYVDEAPLGSSNGYSAEASTSFDMMPYDLERVEVLRGPQGTLYGANSMGGLLKYVTRAPHLNDYEVRAGAEVSTTEGAGKLGYIGRVGINAPLIPGELAVRASVFHEQTPGYIDNYVTGGKGENSGRQDGARLALLWQPTDALSVKASATYQDGASKGNGIVRLARDGTTPLGPVGGDLTNGNILAQPFKKRTLLLATSVNWDLGWADFISATSYSKGRLRSTTDYSDVYASVGLSDLRNAADLRRYTQEFRLASRPGKFEWLAGLYYDDEFTKAGQYLSALDPATRTPVPDLDPLLRSSLRSAYREGAVFGNATYHFTDAFDVTAGLRWARNRQTLKQDAVGALLENGPTGPVTGKSEDDVLTYAISSRYRLGADYIAYLRVARGYRPGGPNPVFPGVPSQVNADTIINYEGGLKGDLLEHRLQLDLSVFRIDWKDIQLEAHTPDGSVSFGANGGTARSQGVELSTLFIPVKGVQLGFNTAYTDAVLTEAVPSMGWADKARMPSAPRWTASVTANYETRVTDDWMLRLGGGYRYIGARFNDVEGGGNTVRLPEYGALDLNASLSNSRWTLGFFVRNAADRRVYPNGGVVGSYFQGVVLQPRTIGVSLDAAF
ncbi:MAG: TonB-dependent receptor [Caulobacteraceae bacterium]|nr:TonB-dependent receptor [Caulobacteraceae bacterium]